MTNDYGRSSPEEKILKRKEKKVREIRLFFSILSGEFKIVYMQIE